MGRSERLRKTLSKKIVSPRTPLTKLDRETRREIELNEFIQLAKVLEGGNNFQYGQNRRDGQGEIFTLQQGKMNERFEKLPQLTIAKVGLKLFDDFLIFHGRPRHGGESSGALMYSLQVYAGRGGGANDWRRVLAIDICLAMARFNSSSSTSSSLS